ncbi:MAG: AAA family ATPase [Leeuwenhoekiella sp.]
MKILKIAFKNINSLRGEHAIDFTQKPFTQNNLFAITGPTGSGKTTILDVISLALFNQVPRLGRMSTSEILKKGAILTRNQQDAYATITYSCAKGIFVSKWEISTARTGNLRDYHMEVANVETNKILPLKKSEVPGKNEELIGLNYDQFIKSVVLAQGEFAQFLQVPKKERGALLEKITGTEIYRKIGQAVHLKHKERAEIISLKRNKVETYREQLLDEKVFAEKLHEAEKLEQEKKTLKVTVEKLSKEITLKENLQKQQNELTTTTEALAKVNTRKKEFKEEKGDRLKRHQQIQLVAEDLNIWLSLREKTGEKKQEIIKATEALQRAETKRESLTQKFSQQFHLEINPENFGLKTQEYKKEVRQLIADRQELLTTFTASKTPVEVSAKRFELDFNPKKIGVFLSQVEQKKDKHQSEYKDIEERFDLKNHSVPTQQENIERQLRQWRQAEKSFVQLNNLKEQQQEREKALQTLEKQKAELPEAIEKLLRQIELKQAQLEAKQKSLEVEQLQKQLDDYRNDLKPDEPCPLCGSVHHPFAKHHPQQENKLKSVVSQMERELKTLEKEQVEKQTALRQLENQVTELNRQLTIINEQLLREQQQFDESYKGILGIGDSVDFNEQEKKLESRLKQLAAAQKLKENLEILNDLTAQTRELETLIAKGSAKSSALEKLYGGYNFEIDISNLETSWNANEQAFKQYQRTKKTSEEILAKLTTQHEALTTALLQQLSAKGYASIEEALQNRLDAVTAQTWTKEYDTIKQEEIRLGALSKKLSEEIELLKQTASDSTVDELQQESNSINEDLAKTEAAANTLSHQVQNHRQFQKQISDLRKAIEKDLADSGHWQVLYDLIGDATGNKFNDFAQDLTLSQLLQLANKRLQLLTDRYRIDQPKDDEDDSLVAIDEHMGGQRRSIKTLSGGETFILSLALALALSDLASRNVEINSLFIDEGFGTLDPETLDQTLDTLEVLQAESNKTIGVISHVDSLKERIATQIQLTQNGQGYSSLTIV